MLAHENTRTSDVMAPSHGSRNSTLTDFEFDDDPLMSPRPVNNNYASRFRNPSVQKNYEQEKDLDYAIDTSALHNALPEFSDGQSVEGEEYDEEDISIEIGRGRKTHYRMDDSRDSLMSLDDSRLTASLVDGRDELRQSKTAASKSALRSVSNRSALRKADTLRKDAQIRRASLLAQKEGLEPRLPKARSTSDGALQSQRQQRRTLTDMHAKVSEVYDGSYLGDERPSSPHVTTRNTRFGTAKTYDKEKIDRAVRRAAKGYVEESVESDSRRQQRNNTESFLLPDVENLSELVSGIYQDGIPINARQTRPRTTRFTSPPAVEIPEEETEQHVRFDGVPIPEDEKAIFNSLRLLQRKVSALEKDNADVEGKLDELRQENTILRAEQLRRQRRVSGDEEEFARGGAATLAVERNRLEAANLALREQLEAANRKLSDNESSVERVKQERNSVVNQLGTVYLSCQELKSENEALQQENDELKVQLAILMSGKRKSQQDGASHANEQTRTKRNIPESRPEPDDVQQTSRERAGKPTTDNPTLDERAQELLSQTKDNNYDALFSLGLPSRRTEPKELKEQGILKKESKSDKKQPNIRKQRSKRAIIDLEDGTEFETTMDTREIQTQTVSQDLTYLSFVDSREIAQLRKTLEEERIARKSRRSRGVSGQDKFHFRLETLTRDFTKASFKDATRRSSKSVHDATNHSQSFDVTEGPADPTTEQRDPTSRQEDVTRASSRRGSRSEDAGAEDMTSAFILPDITIHGMNGTTGPNGKEEIQLPPSAQRILDKAVRHERSNCTVCKKGTPCTNAADPEPITIPQPQPVSERATEQPNEDTTQNPNLNLDIDENDHTMRPSQPPAMALAKVLKALEDELAHLKMQLAVCQSRYSRHDAAVGRRKRVKLGEQMKALMGEIESKSEVVYALYDVLEGQKGEGEGNEKEKEKARHGECDEEDEELPWEGFESTQDDFTGRSGMSRKVLDV